MAILMPPPFSMQHHTFLRSYKQTQKGNLLGTGPREVVGAHKNGFVFPVKVTIEKTIGADGYTGVFFEVRLFCAPSYQKNGRSSILLKSPTTQNSYVMLCLCVSLQVHEDPNAGIAWTSGAGQLYCVSKGFLALLGYSFQDLKRSIQAIG